MSIKTFLKGTWKKVYKVVLIILIVITSLFVAPLFQDNNISIQAGGNPITISVNLTADVGDVEECYDAGASCGGVGGMDTASSDIEMHGTEGTEQVGAGNVGLLFENVDVPQGATISNVTISFEADETDNASTLIVTFSGEDIDDAPAYTSTDFNVTNRVQTSARVNWTIAQWSIDERSADTTTSNLKDIVQEIVDRSGWSANNSMNFMIRERFTDGNGERTAEDADTASEAAELFITYSLSEGTPPTWNETPYNITIGNSSALSVDWNASDDVAVDKYFINTSGRDISGNWSLFNAHYDFENNANDTNEIYNLTIFNEHSSTYDNYGVSGSDYQVNFSDTLYFEADNFGDFGGASKWEIDFAFKHNNTSGETGSLFSGDNSDIRISIKSGRTKFFYETDTTSCKIDWFEYGSYLSDDQWYFHTMVYNGTHIQIIDNVSTIIRTETCSGTGLPLTSYFRLGQDDSATFGSGGFLDCVSIYINNTLSSSDRQSAYDYCFEGVTSNFAIDSSTGVMTNATTLSIANYSINLSVNDSSNSVLSEVIYVDVYDDSSQPLSNSCTLNNDQNDVVQCGDGCNWTSNFDKGGYNILFNASGTVTITANLTNVGNTTTQNSCVVLKKDGGGIRR